MKFRTGFVTNSSSSSFLVYNVKHPALYDFLTSLGIQIGNCEDGNFTAETIIRLPSGAELSLYDIDADWAPIPSESSSLTAWMLCMFLAEVESSYPPKELSEYQDSTLELLRLLNEHKFIDMDLSDENAIDRLNLTEQLHFFDKMDSSVEEANVELCTGFEGDISQLEYVSAKNGYCLSITLNEWDCDGVIEDTLLNKRVCMAIDDDIEKEETIAFIIAHGGTVVDMNTDVDICVCNDRETFSKEITFANDWCIPVISLCGFLYRYGSVDPFDVVDGLYDELYECTYEGDFYDIFYEYGIGNLIRKKL